MSIINDINKLKYAKKAINTTKNIATKIGDNPTSSTLISIAGAGIATGGDTASTLALGTMVAGGAAIMNRINNSLKIMKKNNLEKNNEALELSKAFLGKGKPEYDAMALLYSAAGTIGATSTVMAGILHGPDAQALITSGIIGAGVGFTGASIMAGVGYTNQKIRFYAAKRADPLVDLAVGKINVKAVADTYNKISKKQLPQGVRDIIRDNPIELHNPYGAEMSTYIALGRQLPQDNTRIKKIKTGLARTLFPITEAISSSFLGSSISDFINQDIIGAAKSAFNLRYSVPIPGTKIKIGGLEIASRGKEIEPLITSKLKLGVTGTGIASIGALGFEIASNGAPGYLSGLMLSAYGLGSVMNTAGLHDAIGYATMLPDHIKNKTKEYGYNKTKKGIKTMKGFGKKVIEEGLINIAQTEETKQKAIFIKNQAKFTLKTSKKLSTGFYNYIKDGNSGVLRFTAEDIIKKDYQRGSIIGRTISPFLEEKDRIKLAKAEIKELRKRKRKERASVYDPYNQFK